VSNQLLPTNIEGQAQSMIGIGTSDACITNTGALDARGSAPPRLVKVHYSNAICRVDRAIRLWGDDGVSERMPVACYLSKVSALCNRVGAIKTDEWVSHRRRSDRRKAFVDTGASYSAGTGSEAAWAH